MRFVSAVLMVFGFAGAAAGEVGDLTLRGWMQASDVVVVGEFTSKPDGVPLEGGAVRYQAQFEIEHLLQGEPLGQRRVGGTIPVNVVRQVSRKEGPPAPLKKGGRAVLFLTANERKEGPVYFTADVWYGMQPASTGLVESLARVTDASARKPGADDFEGDLGGAWRMLLPAGVDREVSLFDTVGTKYTLQPASLSLGGFYELDGDRLVSTGPKKRKGVYVWKIHSPWMLTLTEQPKGVGSDYTGAVLFRKGPDAKRESDAGR